jgi:GT2 family glycosyltransferase
MFEEIGGFDENYWMYLEDVDLSWRSWIAGYKVLQNPRAIANHFTGLYFKYDNNSYTIEHFWSIRNFLYISYKFFGRSGLQQALEMVDKLGYKGNLKTKAISNFKKLKARKTIEQVDVPDELNNLIHIFGYNKFSEYPS